jgi:hypothetical protein
MIVMEVGPWIQTQESDSSLSRKVFIKYLMRLGFVAIHFSDIVLLLEVSFLWTFSIILKQSLKD